MFEESLWFQSSETHQMSKERLWLQSDEVRKYPTETALSLLDFTRFFLLAQNSLQIILVLKFNNNKYNFTWCFSQKYSLSLLCTHPDGFNGARQQKQEGPERRFNDRVAWCQIIRGFDGSRWLVQLIKVLRNNTHGTILWLLLPSMPLDAWMLRWCRRRCWPWPRTQRCLQGERNHPASNHKTTLHSLPVFFTLRVQTGASKIVDWWDTVGSKKEQINGVCWWHTS